MSLYILAAKTKPRDSKGIKQTASALTKSIKQPPTPKVSGSTFRISLHHEGTVTWTNCNKVLLLIKCGQVIFKIKVMFSVFCREVNHLAPWWLLRETLQRHCRRILKTMVIETKRKTLEKSPSRLSLNPHQNMIQKR